MIAVSSVSNVQWNDPGVQDQMPRVSRPSSDLEKTRSPARGLPEIISLLAITSGLSDAAATEIFAALLCDGGCAEACPCASAQSPAATNCRRAYAPRESSRD